jgi:hypothetical protein
MRLRMPAALIRAMHRTPTIRIDYNSDSDLPSESSLLLDGEKPLSPLWAAVAFLIGLGVIMSVVTFCIARG